eukprot:9472183-Pyramimonas_sp.AAC.1
MVLDALSQSIDDTPRHTPMYPPPAVARRSPPHPVSQAQQGEPRGQRLQDRRRGSQPHRVLPVGRSVGGLSWGWMGQVSGWTHGVGT